MLVVVEETRGAGDAWLCIAKTSFLIRIGSVEDTRAGVVAGMVAGGAR